MHQYARNVNDAFRWFVSYFGKDTPTTNSRNGKVKYIADPVIVTYSKPQERVLLLPGRDANPFLHLYEALWMLAGRNDLAPLAYYNKRMQDYSDDGITLNGAYGYRWRHAEVESGGTFPLPNYTTVVGKIDQLKAIIQHLSTTLNSRRAVLQMWNVGDDLTKIDSSKDVCCNLSVLFGIDFVVCPTCRGMGEMVSAHQINISCPDCVGSGFSPEAVPSSLNVTVYNRSNDLVWGMLGSNYVCFSILQEYVAAHLGLEVGKYHQVTNNLHVYEWNWKPDEWLAISPVIDYNMYPSIPLIKDPATFDRELLQFVDLNSNWDSFSMTRLNELSARASEIVAEKYPERLDQVYSCGWNGWVEPWLNGVAQPMCLAFHNHKQRDYPSALAWAQRVADPYWRYVAEMWITKRYEAWFSKLKAL